MPPRRLEAVASPIRLRVDGENVPARAGEPVAVALAASGRLLLARSVKYHRPRGAACYAARCDGCLMRVDGIGNVMTCRVPARDGMIVETQNVIGFAERDLLAATDWFFPGGMNHHEMMTSFAPLNKAMQKVARRIAGIGALPGRLVEAKDVRDATCDVLVVGAGPAGLVAARDLAKAGRDVLVVDEAEAAGGTLRIFPGLVRNEDGLPTASKDLAVSLVERATAAGAKILLRHTAFGHYREESRVLVHGPEGIVRIATSHVVIATGAHEGAASMEGGDLPGVIGVRAACVLLSHGVLPGERVVVAGTGPWCDALATALSSLGAHVIRAASVRRARGRPQVRSADVTLELGENQNEGGKGETTERVECDCVAVAATPSAAYEIAEQGGAHVRFDGRAFLVESAGENQSVVGECTGERDLGRTMAQARAVSS